jgi:hypothetical protein
MYATEKEWSNFPHRDVDMDHRFTGTVSASASDIHLKSLGNHVNICKNSPFPSSFPSHSSMIPRFFPTFQDDDDIDPQMGIYARYSLNRHRRISSSPQPRHSEYILTYHTTVLRRLLGSPQSNKSP